MTTAAIANRLIASAGWLTKIKNSMVILLVLVQILTYMYF